MIKPMFTLRYYTLSLLIVLMLCLVGCTFISSVENEPAITPSATPVDFSLLCYDGRMDQVMLGKSSISTLEYWAEQSGHVVLETEIRSDPNTNAGENPDQTSTQTLDHLVEKNGFEIPETEEITVPVMSEDGYLRYGISWELKDTGDEARLFVTVENEKVLNVDYPSLQGYTLGDLVAYLGEPQYWYAVSAEYYHGDCEYGYILYFADRGVMINGGVENDDEYCDAYEYGTSTIQPDFTFGSVYCTVPGMPQSMERNIFGRTNPQLEEWRGILLSWEGFGDYPNHTR